MSLEDNQDNYFETELRKRLRKDAIKNLDLRMHPLGGMNGNSDIVSDLTKTTFKGLDEVLDAYFYEEMGQDTEYDVIADRTEDFINGFTNRKITEMYNQHEFTDEEMAFMKYTTITHKWRDQRNLGIGAAYAIRDILLRDRIIREFGEDALPKLKKAAEGLKSEYGFSAAKRHFSALFSDHPYGEHLKEDLEKEIDKETELSFNQRINCGGYALKVDTWINPPYHDGLDGKLADLLSKFPFVRLLQDGKVAEDEYLVLYRTKGEMAHHFARVENDGVVREKDGEAPPQIFKGWNEYVDAACEAELAVKKDHPMFGYEYMAMNTGDKNMKIPQEIKEYVSTPRARRPIIEDGKLVNYSDYFEAPTKSIEEASVPNIDDSGDGR